MAEACGAQEEDVMKQGEQATPQSGLRLYLYDARCPGPAGSAAPRLLCESMGPKNQSVLRR